LEWAARKLPADRRDRYFEEWSAHLATLPTPFSTLIEALRFTFAAVHMRFEHEGKAKLAQRSQDMIIRAADVAVATTALILFAPLLVGVSLLIYLTDPGPVMFRQTRVGRHGKPFAILKFRTMRVASNDIVGTDPKARITRFGRFLRATSLDELPQLLNVIRGSMSIVGPRPMGPAEARLYGRDIRYYTPVRPGVTGLAQISRNRACRFRRRASLERLFLRRRSIRLYIALMWLTVVVLFQSSPGD
jgi:lipopolysaccharide/colanic/teichoic acid biosynthesis glycosyltransferase